VTFIPTYKSLPVNLLRGEGSWVFDDKGERYLDMYAGHAVTSTGHCHPTVVRAIQEQASKLIFYSNVVRVQVREEAARRLIDAAPKGLTHALFVNSGAEAIENAVKLAVLQTGRRKVVAFQGGFHGRTLLAINLTESPKYRSTAPYPVNAIRFEPWAEPPPVDRDTACVLLEPIQSMAGVRTAPPEFFLETSKRCREAGAMLIYDEIQTGIGRCGDLFYAGRHAVLPDMICLAKGIASGVPLGAVLSTAAVADRVEYGQLGATFGAGPLAMAAMDATLRVIAEERVLDNVRARGRQLFEGLRRAPGVEEVRGDGLLIGVKLAVETKAVVQKLLAERVIAGGSDDPKVLRLMPPLTLQASEGDLFLGAFRKAMAS
jgi:acetylornithine/N-succinyldiaminopimelate aminotransferase